MTPPNENLIAAALERLQAAATRDEITRSTAALTEGMGLERYVIVDVRAGQIAGVHHNGPVELNDQLAFGTDRILDRARASNTAFAWQAASETWFGQHGELGYRAGVAGASFDPSGSGCITIAACSSPSIPAEHEYSLLGYAVLAAVHIGAALRPLAATPSACPLSERELDCLLHALAGRTAKETARALDIGARTVEQYLERARARMKAQTTYAAATIALRRGWLDMKRASELADLQSAAGSRKGTGV